MKKKILLIIPIIILISVIVIISIAGNKKSSIDFNTDIKISTTDTRLNNKLESYSNSSYDIENIDTVVLDNEVEEKIVDVAYKMTEALNQTDDNHYVENLYQYFKRIPSEKIGTEFFSDVYKVWSSDYTSVSALAYVLQSHSFKYEKITGYNITYASSERYLVQVYIENFKGFYGTTPVSLDSIFEYEIIYEDISELYKVSHLEVEWVQDLEKYYTENDIKERNQNKNDSSTFSNVSTYIPDGYTNFDYSKLEKVTTNETNQIYTKNKDSGVVP